MDDNRVPAVARLSLGALARQYANTTAEIRAFEKHIHAWHRSCEESRRIEEIPGVGPIVATALVAEVGDWKAFSSGRNLAAWIGLVPKQHSTGGKERLGGISKQGNRYLRWLLIAGSKAVDTRGSTVRNGFGSRRNVGRSRLPLSRWPTKSHVWPGP